MRYAVPYFFHLFIVICHIDVNIAKLLRHINFDVLFLIIWFILLSL